MSSNIEIRLGSEAVDYIESCLQDGNTLSRSLLHTHDLRVGKVRTFLPESVSYKAANEFTLGGKLPTPDPETHKVFTGDDGFKWIAVPVPTADAETIAIIRNFLEAEQNHACILENAVAGASDPWLCSITTRALTYGSEVYHLITHDDIDDPNNIVNTIKDAMSWRLIGALTSAPHTILLAPRLSAISEGELKTIAERATSIVVSAYDGEGYLIWSA